jgi:hypothetical protein
MFTKKGEKMHVSMVVYSPSDHTSLKKEMFFLSKSCFCSHFHKENFNFAVSRKEKKNTFVFSKKTIQPLSNHLYIVFFPSIKFCFKILSSEDIQRIQELRIQHMAEKYGVGEDQISLDADKEQGKELEDDDIKGSTQASREARQARKVIKDTKNGNCF